MVNRNLFANSRVSRLPVANAVNRAGGKAYSMTSAEALCQYVTTGTFNGTFYASGDNILKELQSLVCEVEPELVAKAAVYGHEVAKMKDIPAYLVAELAARGELGLLREVWPRVITNTKMLCNFVQIIRSGVTGRKSFGSAVKNLIKDWLVNQNPDRLFTGSIGHADPSVADVIKMVHPRASNDTQNNTFAYLIGKDYTEGKLPRIARSFEQFKRGDSYDLPEVPFQALSNITLTESQWRKLAINMPWNTLRMNLNQLAKHNVFDDADVTRQIVAKLTDAQSILSAKALPYGLMTAFLNVKDVPMSVKNALCDAMELATQNTPTFDGNIAVCIDKSGSMHCPVTGNRRGGTTVITCQQVAALFASCILRRNADAQIVVWDTQANLFTNNLNPRDSIMTNAQKLFMNGGGTNAASALSLLNSNKSKLDTVIYLSDNESWYDGNNRGGHGCTAMNHEWTKFKERNRKAKLICIDLAAGGTVQTPNAPDVLNVGGFNDSVFTVIKDFISNSDGNSFVKAVQNIQLK